MALSDSAKHCRRNRLCPIRRPSDSVQSIFTVGVAVAEIPRMIAYSNANGYLRWLETIKSKKQKTKAEKERTKASPVTQPQP